MLLSRKWGGMSEPDYTRCKWCSKLLPEDSFERFCSEYCQKEGRSRLYSREEFEEDVDYKERLRHCFRQMLIDKQINGFQFNTLSNGLDTEIGRLKGKLFVTRMRLQERDELRKKNRGGGR